MISLDNFCGPCRVVIDRIMPAVDGGILPLKRIEGEAVGVEVHAVADGHDIISLVLQYRLMGEALWKEVEMRAVGNDVYTATFLPEGIGLYEYGVSAWCDPFVNWHDGFVKKSAARDPKIEVELQIGAAIVEAAAARASGAERKQLTGWARILKSADEPLDNRMALAQNVAFTGVMRRYPDRTRQTVSAPCELLVEREKAIFSTWYEFFPRSARDDGQSHGTLRDAAGKLPLIAGMGFDVVYLPPIHPIGKVFRKGRNNALTAEPEDVGSPWAIGSDEGGHKAIHPQLGTKDDFIWFRQEVERHGMELALDIAFQCAPDHPYVKEHPQWFKWRPDGTVQYAENPPKKYQDILPFDFENEDWKALWLELKSVFDFWIEQGVKIFRVDNPHTKPLEFWRWCILEIKLRHPEVIFLAEAFTRPKRKYRLAKGGFTQGYTYFTWRNHAHEMREYLTELTQDECRDYFFPNFWPNTPDILHEDLQSGNRATYLGRYVLAATLASNTGIYGPAFELMDSEPFPGKEEYNHNEKYQLKVWDWSENAGLRPEIRRINQVRKENPALQRTANLTFVDSDNPHFIAYLKYTPDRTNQLLIIVSMDWKWEQMGHVFLPLAKMGLGTDKEFTVRDLLDTRQPAYRWRGSRNFVHLDPLKSAAHVFRIEF